MKRSAEAEIRAWLRNARRLEAAYLLVAQDWYAADEYPMYVWSGESLTARIEHWNGLPHQRIRRVIPVPLSPRRG